MEFSGYARGLSRPFGVHGAERAGEPVSDLTTRNLRSVDAARELSRRFGDPGLLAGALGAITVAYEALAAVPPMSRQAQT